MCALYLFFVNKMKYFTQSVLFMSELPLFLFFDIFSLLLTYLSTHSISTKGIYHDHSLSMKRICSDSIYSSYFMRPICGIMVVDLITEYAMDQPLFRATAVRTYNSSVRLTWCGISSFW